MAKTTNLLSGLSNTRTRTFVLLLGSVIVLGILVAVFRSRGHGPSDELAKQGSQTVGVPSTIKATPGTVVSEKYRELQQAENERRAQDALKAKSSAIPTIVGAIAQTPDKLSAEATLDAALKTPDASLDTGGGFAGGGVFGKTAQDRNRELQDAKIKEQQDRIDRARQEKDRLAEQERQRRLAEQQEKAYVESVRKTEAQMKAYIQGAYNDWSKVTPQAFIRGQLAEKEYIKEQTTVVTEATVDTRFGRRIGGRPLGSLTQKAVVKAGTVFYAVLDTAVNSDEPGPVLATIVSGKYRGAKMIGTLAHQGQQETVLINFTTMSLPGKPNSIGVQAVAIDPETARTALATDVDKHYLLRYGSLFAASFMSGYGKAITQEGTTTTSPLTGTTTTTTPPLSGKDKALAALGEVGTQWAQQVKPFFNLPYTVSVNQGTSIGVLFVSDVDLGSEPQPILTRGQTQVPGTQVAQAAGTQLTQTQGQ